MSDQPPIPNVEAIQLWKMPDPPQLKEGIGPIKWVKYGGRERCEDCQQNIYDAMMAGGKVNPQAANVARYKRTRAGVSRFICIEHHNARAEMEAK